MLAQILINDRFFFYLRERDSLVWTGLDTGIATGTVCISHNRHRRPHDADICNLGMGTGIGAITQNNAKFMVKPDIFTQRRPEKRQDIRLFHQVFQIRHERGCGTGCMGAAFTAETGGYVIALYLFCHAPFGKKLLL
jgi:hypothetical protein